MGENSSTKDSSIMPQPESIPSLLKDWLQASRFHQWLKNLLIFVPIFTSHRFNDMALVFDSMQAFLFFGLCASSGYLLNDLLDMNVDRCHPRKCQRPLASGRISHNSGLTASLLLLAVAFSGSVLLLPQQFSTVLAIYYGTSLAYSFWLKRYFIIDVAILAILHTLRIVAGAAAVHQPIAAWLLVFSMLLFFSLALVKRYAEIYQAKKHCIINKINGRGYSSGDQMLLSALGTASGCIAVLVFVLYINEIFSNSLFKYPQFLWFTCPLLINWLARIWILSYHGRMNEDPILFVVFDRPSLLSGVAFVLIFFISI